VIVPARNEAEHVAACLESLAAQDYANLRVIAVDDRSLDRTGPVIEAVVSAHPQRLEMLSLAGLPPNWLGKTYAMALAARHAIAAYGPDYLLFTDADVLFAKDAIRRSLAQVKATEADHLVVLPTTIVKTRGEGMMLAYLQVMGAWAVRLGRVADPKAKRDAIGVGAFNLIRTGVYRELGGFDAMPMEILEDLTLGRRVKCAGFRQRVAVAPGMVRLHWAAGVLGILSGMTKNLFAVFRFRTSLLLGAALWVALFCIGPVVLLAFPGTRLAAFIALASVIGLYVVSSRTSRISPLNAVFFPMAAALLIYAMLRSMLTAIRTGGVTWRGTSYSLAALRAHAERAHEVAELGNSSFETRGGTKQIAAASRPISLGSQGSDANPARTDRMLTGKSANSQSEAEASHNLR
jgi:GT2 family glycosyltransferase